MITPDEFQAILGQDFSAEICPMARLEDLDPAGLSGGSRRHTDEQYPLPMDAPRTGCAMAELQQVLPALGRRAIQVLLDELRAEGRVRVTGRTRGARWIAAEDPTAGSAVEVHSRNE